MAKTIIKIKDRFCEYSTIVDAPVTYLLTREQFVAYYKEEYGDHGFEELASRMARVDAKGTSSHLEDSMEETIALNRAGPKGETLTADEIYEKFKYVK